MNILVSECLICEKHKVAAAPVYQNDMLYVSHRQAWREGDAVYLGYYFIEPKRHFRGMYDATDEEMAALGIMMKRLAQALISLPEIEHVYSFIMGEGVNHFHIHLVARYAGAPKEYLGAKVDEWPNAPKGDKTAIAVFDEKVRSNLQRYIENDFA
ncbi:HIT family protein [Enterococcus sp. LJL51]|uniref:HIT family protein n=1 Tax=Enterococcus sp. LJL51 TaxID=3416656 RepID=UPI003CECEF95